jgi:hypothetical protein
MRHDLRWYIAIVTGCAALGTPIDAHVTIRTAGPVEPSGYASVALAVPNERHVDTTRVVLEVPDDFLRAGGRISRVEYPPNWQVRLEKQPIPEDIYARESEERSARRAERAAAAEHAPTAEDPAEAQREEAAMEQMRRQWIKRVVFEQGAIPPDGWAEFRLSVQSPDTTGRYRFPAIQVYADGKEVGWTQLVEGAQRPAPTLVVETRAAWMSYVWPTISVIALAVSLAALTISRRRVSRAPGSEQVTRAPSPAAV